MSIRSATRMAPLCAIAFMLLGMGGIQAQAALNDTGITVCAEATRSGATKPLIECVGTRQDAEFGRDRESPDPNDGTLGFSFVKICNSGESAGEGTCPVSPVPGNKRDQWRCTADQVTGLVWEIKLDGAGVFGKDARYTNFRPDQPAFGSQTDAEFLRAQANASQMCGIASWRLPEDVELHSLADYGSSTAPLIDKTWFPKTAPSVYWAATDANAAASRQPSPNHAWGMSHQMGILGFAKRLEKQRVRLVSGLSRFTAPAALERFQVSIDGTEVSDRETGLVWKRCSEGQDPITCEGAARTFARERVLSRVLPDGWRLPNIKELRSIVDTRNSYPSMNPGVFPNSCVEGAYWSSSIVADTGYLWFVGIGIGAVDYRQHSAGAVRLVRGPVLP